MLFRRFSSFALFFLFTFAKGQFISELPVGNTLDKYFHEQTDYKDSGILSNRFVINHGFSTSMISNGKSFYSMSGINNNFSYNLLNNLAIQGNVGLFMVKSPFQKNNLMMNQMLMTYDASITYQPFKNAILQFHIQNAPRQGNFSSFYKRFNQ